MKILVVSGFLGSGKTTFIKELIRRTGEKPVILENEYGENDLDSRELAGTGPAPLEVLEFMEGCVCCTQKDSFANTILSISASLDPEYLVVEPTGIGKLSNILANIDRVSWEQIQVLRSIVVLAPRSLAANLRDFPDICKDQISNAQIVVFSKVEREDRDVVAAAADYVRSVNPRAELVQAHYTGQDDAWWRGLFLHEADRVAAQAATVARGGEGDGRAARSHDSRSHDDHGHDGHIHDGDHDHDGHSHDGDHDHDHEHAHDIDQLTFHDVSLTSFAQLVVLLEDALRGRFGILPRAKGVVRVGQEWLRFDVADGLYGIIAEESESPQTQCVFIGKQLDERALRSRFEQAAITQAS